MRSITARLTFFYAVVLAGILLGFGTFVYLAFQNTVTNQSLSEAELQARNLYIHVLAWEAALRSGASPTTPLVGGPNGLVVGMRLSAYAEVVAPSGQVLYKSPNLGRALLPLPPPTRASGVRYVRHTSQGHLALVALSFPVPGGAPGLILVGQNMDKGDELLLDLLRILLLGGSGALLITVAGGMLVARAALRPVDRMNRIAGRITGGGDLSERLPVQGPRDELYQLAETLNGMLSRLEASFRRERQFVSDASHELRTPLMVVQGYAGLLRRWGKEDPQMVEEAARSIEREIGRLSRMAEDLLLLARGETLPVREEQVLLPSLLGEIAAGMALVAPARQMRVETEGVDGPALLDASLLSRILTGLLENAVTYTEEGGRILLFARPEGESVVIGVQDDGIGIAAEDLPYVSERFYRADKARSRRKGGTGLGLAIAKELAGRMGGSLQIHSETGRGTTVEIRLPSVL